MTHVFTEERPETVGATTGNVSWVDEKRGGVRREVLGFAVSTKGEG